MSAITLRRRLQRESIERSESRSIPPHRAGSLEQMNADSCYRSFTVAAQKGNSSQATKCLIQWRTMRRIRVIDSHTAGEPTRVVMEGGPRAGRCSPMGERLERFRSRLRSVPVGGRQRAARIRMHWWARCSANRIEPGCAAGVIFFNNVGYLGMCGHGTIGTGRYARLAGAAYEPGSTSDRHAGRGGDDGTARHRRDHGRQRAQLSRGEGRPRVGAGYRRCDRRYRVGRELVFSDTPRTLRA